MDEATTKAFEATAKATDKALTIVSDTGAYLKEVIGDLPKNAVGLLGGDWIAHKRSRNLDALQRRTQEILRERDVTPKDNLSPILATELLSGAQEHSHERLIELRARLLANALDPSLNNVRRSYIEILKSMDPQDALIIDIVHERPQVAIQQGDQPSGSNYAIVPIATSLETTVDDVTVSLEHMTRLDVFGKTGNSWAFTATGREFIRACYP